HLHLQSPHYRWSDHRRVRSPRFLSRIRPRRKRLRNKISPTSPLQNRKKSLCRKASNIPLKWEATHACESRRIFGGDLGKQGEWGPLKRLNRRRPATVTIPNI